MTEAEWFAAVPPLKMLDYLDSIDALTDRKQRLLDCACVRRIWHLLTDAARSVVETAERYADGQAEFDEMSDLRGDVLSAVDTEVMLNVQATNAGVPRHIGNPNRYSALSAAAGTAWEYRWGTNPLSDAANAISTEDVSDDGLVGRRQMKEQLFAEQRFQSDLVREVFGNPFKPVEFSRDWQTDTAVLLALQMYDSRDFSAMPRPC